MEHLKINDVKAFPSIFQFLKESNLTRSIFKVGFCLARSLRGISSQDLLFPLFPIFQHFSTFLLSKLSSFVKKLSSFKDCQTIISGLKQTINSGLKLWEPVTCKKAWNLYEEKVTFKKVWNSLHHRILFRTPSSGYPKTWVIFHDQTVLQNWH